MNCKEKKKKKICLWTLSECSGKVSKMGMLLGAQPKTNVEDTHIHVESMCHGTLQQYYRINYRLVAGGVKLHQASREGS